MIETEDLILDKAKFSDWEGMYRNVWSRSESNRHMLWNLTTSEEDAQIRIQKTIEYQKEHESYIVYEKSSGTPIGFAGINQIAPHIYEDTGICLGPDYVGRGLGKQLVRALLHYCKENLDATEFIYSSREENTASIGLAQSLGFVYIGSKSRTDTRNGYPYTILEYSMKL
ncbi:MAG: GNAT family N-acetyltransferase [bacterium]|nr:GNAT family N-acetyltransferase [bacterium]MCM1376746.1 GNAT family N-acetyltransferase [Muribaculum sp.]